MVEPLHPHITIARQCALLGLSAVGFLLLSTAGQRSRKAAYAPDR